jgi:hypothetical protein
MIDQIPLHLRELIHRNISVKDRAMLETLFPKTDRISLNSRLGIALKYLVKNRPPTISVKLQAFLEKNKDDAVTMEELRDLPEFRMTSFDRLQFDLMMDNLDLDAVGNSEKYPLAFTIYNVFKSEMDWLVDYFTTSSGINVLEMLANRSDANKKWVKTLMYVTFCNMAIRLIDMRNDVLLKRILSMDLDMSQNVAYITSPFTLNRWTNIDCLDLALTMFDVSMEKKKKLLHIFIEECEFDCVEYLMNKHGVAI